MKIMRKNANYLTFIFSNENLIANVKSSAIDTLITSNNNNKNYMKCKKIINKIKMKVNEIKPFFISGVFCFKKLTSNEMKKKIKTKKQSKKKKAKQL